MTMNDTQGVLLVSPPFGSFYAPYVSLAVLAGHLRSRNIPVRVLNVSPLLAGKYCTPDRIEAGVAAIRQSFRRLNAQPRLLPSQAARMTILYPLLREIEQHPVDQFSPETALQIAAYPFWPDCLVNRPLLKMLSGDSIFSSADLIRAAERTYFFTELLGEELRLAIAEAQPLLVGIAAVFDEQMPAAAHCARLIKQCAPDLHVAMGGPFITTHLDGLRNPDFFSLVDSLIFDEGETPLERLYGEIRSGAPDLEQVPGIMFRSVQGEIRKKSAAPPLDMETLAFVDYQACSLERYPVPPAQMRLAVRLSRGCYWQRCTFCRVGLSFCKNFQQPSVDRIFAEIEHVVRTTGVTNFLFSDESSHPLVLEQLSRRILDSGLRIAWSFHTRIDRKLNAARVALFKQAGCTGFQVGIETFSNRLLKVLGKGISEELIAQVLEDIRGILPVHAYMIVGIPGETEQEANRSYEIARQCQDKGLLQGAYFALFQLLPGSDMWTSPEQYGIRLGPSDPAQDCKPNLCADFAVDGGMSREQAFALFFRSQCPNFAAWKAQELEQELRIDGEVVKRRYPFAYLQEILHDALIYQNELPFQGWLAFLDTTMGPIPPQGTPS